MPTIGKRLEKVRQTFGMSLEKFGTHLGYGKARTAARQVMSRIINDHRLPTMENLKQLQNEGVDLNWLVNGVGVLSLEGQTNEERRYVSYHFYDGPHYVETVISKKLNYPEIINMQSDEIYTIRINTEMMSPTIKINDTVNAVRVDRVIENGLYVCINEIEGKPVLWIKRLFLSGDRKSFVSVCDNPTYPKFTLERELLDGNQLNLRVFSLMLTVDKIS